MQLKRPVTNTNALPPEHHLAKAMVMGTSESIEGSEKRGQNELSQSSQLPSECHDGREKLEAIGIKVIGVTPGDPIFLDVVLPDGWKVQPTDHAMWSRLLDDKDRERAAVLYKAAFYDRSAHMGLTRRFNVREHIDGDEEAYYRGKTRQNCVMDCDGKVLFVGPKMEGYGQESRDSCEKWLDENKPNWKDVLAYWDE
jgi:hypothetical protein